MREDFHRFHRVQRKSDSLKAHDVMPKMLPDQEAAQAFGADPRPRGNDDAMAGESPVNRAADGVQAAPPSVIEPKVEPIIGTAPADPSADVAQVTPLPVIEDKPVPITRSHDSLTVVMVMVALVAFSVLGLIEFLFRPTFAKRVLAFGAIPSAKKFTFGEMRAAGVRGVLIYCRDYRCSQWTRLDADRWSDGVRLSDVETRLVCTACGKRGADVRPDVNATGCRTDHGVSLSTRQKAPDATYLHFPAFLVLIDRY